MKKVLFATILAATTALAAPAMAIPCWHGIADSCLDPIGAWAAIISGWPPL